MTSEQIKAIRTKLRMSQEAFALTLGVSFATVNRWENGHNSPTRLARKALYDLASEGGIRGPQLNTASEG